LFGDIERMEIFRNIVLIGLALTLPAVVISSGGASASSLAHSSSPFSFILQSRFSLRADRFLRNSGQWLSLAAGSSTLSLFWGYGQHFALPDGDFIVTTQMPLNHALR